MSGMIVGGSTVVVIHHRHSSMHCDAYKGKLEAVLGTINFGDLGGGCGYGCEQHKAALDQVEKRVSDTRRRIAEIEAEDLASGGAPE